MLRLGARPFARAAASERRGLSQGTWYPGVSGLWLWRHVFQPLARPAVHDAAQVGAASACCCVGVRVRLLTRECDDCRAQLHPLHRQSRPISQRLDMCGAGEAAQGTFAPPAPHPPADQTGDENSGEQAFDIDAPFAPTGDQPEAIEEILQRLEHGCRFTVLRGATGTGKTFTMAHVINRFGRPTLLLCHNKTLAAQLVRELKSYFPHNRVELFVSYYNYYQPEAYLPATDTYIAKTTSINDELDALRHRATRSLCEREDVIVVSTVSCIYGLGLPWNYLSARLALTRGDALPLQRVWDELRAMLYEQATSPEEGSGGILGEGGGYEGLERGFFQVTHHADASDVVVWPPYLDAPTRLRISHGTVQCVCVCVCM